MPRVQVFFEDESRTKQEFKAECDIRNIMHKFSKTGLLPQRQGGSYLDLSEAPDYQDAMNIILEAHEAFDDLPAATRKRFNNDPVEFLEFVHDPKNRDQFVELGLAEKAPEEPILNKTESKDSAAL